MMVSQVVQNALIKYSQLNQNISIYLRENFTREGESSYRFNGRVLVSPKLFKLNSAPWIPDRASVNLTYKTSEINICLSFDLDKIEEFEDDYVYPVKSSSNDEKNYLYYSLVKPEIKPNHPDNAKIISSFIRLDITQKEGRDNIKKILDDFRTKNIL